MGNEISQMLTAMVSEFLTANGILFKKVSVHFVGTEYGSAVLHIQTHNTTINLTSSPKENKEFERAMDFSSSSCGYSVEQTSEVLESFYKISTHKEHLFELLETELKKTL